MSPETITLLVSSGNGPGECRQATGHVLERMRRDAAASRVDIDISERPGSHGPTSAIVMLGGHGAALLARIWSGVVLWRCQSGLRPRHRRKNWFVQVFELPRAAASVAISPDAVDMTAIRAGGPGGQHQNKTSSAIRARWTSPDGRAYSVVVRDQRSQHQNRRIAVERLQALAAADVAESAATRKSAARHLHHQLERGNPSRIYKGPDFLSE